MFFIAFIAKTNCYVHGIVIDDYLYILLFVFVVLLKSKTFSQFSSVFINKLCSLLLAVVFSRSNLSFLVDKRELVIDRRATIG